MVYNVQILTKFGEKQLLTLLTTRKHTNC